MCSFQISVRRYEICDAAAKFFERDAFPIRNRNFDPLNSPQDVKAGVKCARSQQVEELAGLNFLDAWIFHLR